MRVRLHTLLMDLFPICVWFHNKDNSGLPKRCECVLCVTSINIRVIGGFTDDKAAPWCECVVFSTNETGANV